MPDGLVAIGHRGAPLLARENTLASLRAALDLGADWVEIDAKATVDGRVIVLHDATFERLWGDPRAVAETSFASIRESLPSGEEGIPTLAEAVSLVASRSSVLLIDVADVGIASAVADDDAVTTHPAAVAFTGDPEGLALLRSRFPDATIALSWEEPEPPATELLHRVRPDYLNQVSDLVTQEFVADMAARNLRVSTYTVDSASEMRRLIGLGVAGIISNDIELLRSVAAGTPSGGELLDPAEALAFARELAVWASKTIRDTEPGPITVKENPADVVTEVDLLIERTVRERLAERYPRHAVDGEEYGAPTEAAEYTWYLDPIDGTTNFANGLPWSSFSLALADADGPLVGVVADPHRGVVYSALRGGGAFVDERPVHCSTATSLAGTTVLTEWNGHEPWERMNEVVAAIAGDFGTVRIMGSSALALAHAAVGHAAAALIGSYHGVDDMAGVLLAQEAGAVVRGRHGADEPGPDGVMVACPGVAVRLAELWG